MALGRSRKALTASATPQVVPTSIVASAIRTNFSDLSYNMWKFRDESWQRELWRYYDIIPEFSFAARWVGNCCSKVRIYVADVDKLGRVQGETKDGKINALADTLLGNPAAKAEHLRGLGINLTVAGEAYVVGRPGEHEKFNISDTWASAKDEWYILSSSEIRRIQGDSGQWQWAWVGPDGAQLHLDTKRNVVTRVWTPHPARVWCADSPARACMAALRQLEQLVKYTFSQIDSRLVSAGLMIMPNNADLPQDPNSSTSASDSLLMKLATAGAQSLRGEGSAMGVLPTMVESDNPEGWKLLSFESTLSSIAKDLRDEAVNRLGVGLDMPPEVLNGLGSENHWNAFLIDGYGIKVHIEPLMNRICDALTKAYLWPALKLMGKDPSRYVYSYDTSPLALRPQRLQDALNLYEKGILSEEAVREAGYFKESDAPDQEEDVERFLRTLMERDGGLLQNKAVREAAGIPEEIISQDDIIAGTPMDPAMMMGMGAPPPGQEGGGPPAPPVPPTGIQSELPPVIPDTLDQVGQAPPNGIQASSFDKRHEELGIAVLADATVRRSLELAGKRLLDRDTRNRFPDVPAHELHTRIKVRDQAHASRLLLHAWDQLDSMVHFFAPDFNTVPLRKSLERYCSLVLLSSVHHEPQNLLDFLRKEGLISAP